MKPLTAYQMKIGAMRKEMDDWQAKADAALHQYHACMHLLHHIKVQHDKTINRHGDPFKKREEE
jgi:hypothetical protein